MSKLTRVQVVILAKEVLAGKARSYVSAAHALAEFIVDGEAETRILVGDDITARAPMPTLPLPFEDPSPPPGSPCPIEEALRDSERNFAAAKSQPLALDSEQVAPWDAAAKRILESEARAIPRLVPRGLHADTPPRRIPTPFDPTTGVRDALPSTNAGGRVVPRRTMPPCLHEGAGRCDVPRCPQHDPEGAA